jgi:small-conductance mechanosensitive channel
MQLFDITDRVRDYLPHFLAALPVVFAILIGAFLVNLVASRTLRLLARRSHMSDTDILPPQRIVRWLIRLFACILILSVLGFELGGVWAMLSTILGLLAIGFVAVWSLISHTSATMLIVFLHPFQVGDDLEFPGEPVRGRVMDLNFFFTTLLDHEGSLFQVPNNLFFQKTFKRRKNEHIVSLTGQLYARQPAQVQRPPPPETKAEPGKAKEPDPMMNYPDPRTIAPPERFRP